MQNRDFQFRYKVHVFVHCPFLSKHKVHEQAQSTCILSFFKKILHKVQVHQIWYEIEFSGTRVQVFWTFFGQNRVFWTQDFDIEFFIQFFLLKFMFYLNLVPFFGNNLGISFEEKNLDFQFRKKWNFPEFLSRKSLFL